MRTTTITIRRASQDLTVEVVTRDGKPVVSQVIDEDGRVAFLTTSERREALRLVQLGVDETGR